MEIARKKIQYYMPEPGHVPYKEWFDSLKDRRGQQEREMKLTMDHHKELIKKLKDLDFALGYLNVCLEDEDDGVFLLGLRHVAQAHGGLQKLADKTKLNREHLYRLLSKKGNPRLSNLQELAHVFGWRVMLAPEDAKKAA